MRILALDVEWFRHFEAARVDLQEGLTCVVGPNGSGKTTLTIEAVAYALFGPGGVRGKTDSLTTLGAPKGANTQVKLTFAMEGSEYMVLRSTSGATVERDGVRVASGAAASTEYLEGVLGMSRDELLASLIARQKELEWMSGKGPTARRRFLSRVLGYDRLREAQKQLRDETRALKASAETLESQRAAGADELDSKADLIAAYEEAAERITEEEAALESARAEAGEIEARLGASESDALQAEIDQTGETLTGKRSELARLEVALTHSKRDQRELSEERDALVGSADAEDLKESAEAAVSDLEEAQENVDRLTKQHANVKAQLAVAEGQAKKLDAEQGTCSSCGQEITEEYREAAMWGVKARVSELRKVLDGIVEEGRTWKATKISRAESAETLRDKVRDHAKQMSRLAEVNDRLAAIAVAMEEEERKIVELEREIMELRGRAGDLAGQLKEANASKVADQERLGALFKESDATNRRLNDLRAEQKRCDDQMRQHELEDDIRAIRADLAIKGATDRMFGDLTERLNSEVRPEISDIASDLMRIMSEGRFEKLELDEKYEPTLWSGGEQLPVISGGEEDLSNLALRLAVSTLIAQRGGAQLECVLLDEVMGSLDEGRQRAVLRALRRMLEAGRFRQIILVTHTMIGPDDADHIIDMTATTNEGAA